MAWLRQVLAGLEAKGCQVAPEYALEETAVPVGLIIGGCETQCLGQENSFPKHWHTVGPNNVFDNNTLEYGDIVQILYDEINRTEKL